LLRSSKTLLARTAAGLIPLLLALAVARPAALPHSGQQDSYAIYSLLLTGALWKNLDPSQTERWAVAGTTVNAADINPALAPEAALQPPQDHPKWFADAVRDYNARKNQRLSLIRDFQVDRPYVLLTPSEVAEFQSIRTSMNAGSTLQQKYSGIPGITYFSEVYFNPAHTGALVYMLDWCGNLCSQAQWFYLEKQDGHWVRRSGDTPQ
jgi:hypothetical protein